MVKQPRDPAFAGEVGDAEFFEAAASVDPGDVLLRLLRAESDIFVRVMATQEKGKNLPTPRAGPSRGPATTQWEAS